MEKRKCSRCKEEKLLEFFNKNRTRPLGRDYLCNGCAKISQKEIYSRNKDKILKKHKEWQKNNKEYVREKNKGRWKKYTEQSKAWREKVKNTPEFKKKRVDYQRKKRREDLNYRIACNIRGRLRYSLLRRSVKKIKRTKDYLGCDIEFLKKYLESKFTENMSWENYGRIKGVRCWEIDHIKPISKIDLSKEENIAKISHYTNLQPLWSNENKIKNAKDGLQTNVMLKLQQRN